MLGHPGPLLAQAVALPDVEARIAEYRRIMGLFPAFPLVCVNLAHDLHALGRKEEAAAAALRALALDPDQRAALAPDLLAAIEPGASPAPSGQRGDLTGRLGRYRVLAEISSSPAQALFHGIRVADDRPVTLRSAPDMLPWAALRSFEPLPDSDGRIPGCVQALDIATGANGVPYQVLRRLRGETFAELVAGGGLDLEALLGIVHRVALILDQLHSRGLVHGDLRPEHVFREDDDVKKQVVLLGVGLACRPGRTLALAAGRSAWLAPEAGLAPLDFRTDLHGLGLLLRFALSGRPPAPLAERLGGEPARVLWQGREQPLIAAVLKRCLALDPRDRFASAAEAAAALQGAAPARSLGTIALGGHIGKWRLPSAPVGVSATRAGQVRPAGA